MRTKRRRGLSARPGAIADIDAPTEAAASVEIAARRHWRLDTSCTVDTGAPIAFFDRGAGEAVGVRFNRAGAERGTIRMFGGTWHVQFEDVDLTLPVEPELTWEAHVAFVTAADLQMPFQGVLGHDGFLDKFAVTFNKYYDYFIVERPDDFHNRVGRHLTSDPTRTADHRWLRWRGR